MPERPNILYAPWRERYLQAMAAAEAMGAHAGGASEEIPAPSGSPSGGQFLRDYWVSPEQDEANLVVLRRTDAEGASEHARVAGGTHPGEALGGIVLLNLYPYAGGHLLAALGEGRGRLLDYTAAQRAALWRLTDDALAIVERAFAPQGVNIGVNQGRAAGAGLPQHAHVHLVPRWHGDVNFMTVVGMTRVIPASPEAIAKRCRDAWAAIARERGAEGARA